MVDTEENIPKHEVQHSTPLQNRGLNPRLGLNPGFKSNDDTTIELLATTTNFDEPLYNVVTSDALDEYARTILRSSSIKVTKNQLTKKILDVYTDSKKALKETFDTFNGRLVVSCDIWTSFGFEDRYLCVICHWITDDWSMEKRVIGFKLLYPFDFRNIASKLIETLDEFKLVGKVVSLSFDDCVGKEKCVEHLGDEFEPRIVPEMFCHDRSFANAIDVCAQQIVDQLAVVISPVRDLLRWFWVLPEKREEFKGLCKKKGLNPRSFFLDFSMNWRSVYDNLGTICLYKDFLMEIYNGCDDHSPLVESQWSAVRSLLGLLKPFDDVSERFSLAYDTICHLVIQDAITIVRTLKIYEDNPQFCSAVRDVRSKWLELFPEIPTVYCVATILDPRVKVEGLKQLLVYYYRTLGVEYNVDEKVAHSKNVLQQLYSHYSPPRDCKTESSEEEDESKQSSSLDFDVIKNVVKKRKVDNQENTGDLGEYLFFHFDVYKYEDDGYLEIFQWWAKKEELFPVLSKVAKDVLSIPVATRIPKHRSCPGRRLLDEKRSMLQPGLIQVCICKKDWDLAEDGSQGQEEYDAEYINALDFSD